MPNSEKTYRTLFKVMDDGLCILKFEFDENNKPIDYRFLETNPAFKKQTGLKGIEGKKVSEVLLKHEYEAFEIVGDVVLTGKPARFETYVDKLGRWFEICAVRIGEPEERKIAVFVKSITERKQAQKDRKQLLREVKTEREHLSNIFQYAPSFMCVLRGADHVFERVNDFFMQLIGERDVIGKPVREVLPEVEGQGFIELLGQVYSTGETFIGTGVEIELFRQIDSKEQSEERYLDFAYQPIRDPEGSISGVFVQGVDLTERIRAQQELKAINKSLEKRVEERTQSLLSYQNQLRSLASQLNKAEENQRQQLASELHDNLAQLLAVSKLKVDLLEKEQFSSQAATDIDELKEIMGDALSYTRELMSELKPPPSIGEDMMASIEWIAEKMEKNGIEVTIEDDGRLKPLGEEVRGTVLQCIRELLFNVVKHTAEKDAIIRLMRKKNQLKIAVKDEGGGFDVENTEFTPGKDGGYGLFNIQERIDLLGGRVDIVSKIGKGTKVTLYIPLKKEIEGERTLELFEENEQVKKTKTEKSIHQKRISVLLVDDHQMVREGLRKIIEDQADIEVIGEAADGEEAIQLSRESTPDIILMDVSMPGMDGIEATRKITSEMPNIHVIGLSLHDENGVAKEMRNAGASAYLTKTEAFESLIVTIRAEASARQKR